MKCRGRIYYTDAYKELLWERWQICQNTENGGRWIAVNDSGGKPVSNDKKDDATISSEDTDSVAEPLQEEQGQDSVQSGPKFTAGPDPLAGVKKGASDVMASMEGKTVSMKVYVGTIIAVVVLMLLARCGG